MYEMTITPSASFTRPANTTAYGAGDLVANSATSGEVVPMEFMVSKLSHGRGKARRARLHKNDATTTNASFTLHLFTAAPTVTNGDNGALAVSTAAAYLSAVAIDMTSGAFAGTSDLIDFAAVNPEINFDLESGRKIYGLLEAEAAYVPASGEVFTVTLEIEG